MGLGTRGSRSSSAEVIQVHMFLGFLVRLIFVSYGEYHDRTNVLKYTDVDYHVFTDAAREVVEGGSPFDRHTYRYTPFLAWLLMPNVQLNFAFGKLFFSFLDCCASRIIYEILILDGQSKITSLKCSFLWLYNPLVIGVSTRGSAESIMAVLVLLTVYMMKMRLHILAGIFLGASVHFKLYSVIYCLPLYLSLSSVNQQVIGWKQFLPNYSKMRLVCGTVVAFVGLTGMGFILYGEQYIEEAFLYHFSRIDTRHNFSVYFYLLYIGADFHIPGLRWMSTFLFMGAGSLLMLLYLFFYTQYWWVSLCYLTWFLGDHSICSRGGRRVEWVRRLPLWKHYRDFFPIHLIKTCELDPSKNYIMGYHPHGILSAGAFCHFATEGTNFSKNFPGFTPHLLTLEGHFLLPFYREFFMASGAVSATRESMDYLLGREGTGRALCLVVGGAKESLDCHPGEVSLHLSKRKGFCKMALRHGASLVPMFSFGENEIYDQVANPEGSLIRRIQNFLQGIIGLAPCLFIGRGVFQYSFGIVPFRKPIYTVVGTPIDVPQVKMPTKEQIVALHEKYVKAVVDLYNKYKHKYSEFPECEIKIV